MSVARTALAFRPVSEEDGESLASLRVEAMRPSLEYRRHGFVLESRTEFDNYYLRTPRPSP